MTSAGGGLKCSLCSRSFSRELLRYNPVGGGFRHQGSDYLCKQCWQVLSGQPWPAEQGAEPRTGNQGDALGPPPAVPNAFAGHPSLGRAPQHGPEQSMTPASAAFLRRCQSMADFQLGVAGSAPQPVLIQHGWQPASMPEATAVLGSASDPRWGALAAASAPDCGRARLQHAAGSAPVFSPLELRNMMDESSLEIFESQSHLLDPETRLQLQKQRQYLDWQQNSMEESGPMRASLERTDSAGSGNEAPDMASLRQELRALRVERGVAAKRVNEMCQQLQDKKRQLFAAIQEREQLKERARRAEAQLHEYQGLMHCRLCLKAVRNCVVLPCLHFYYCDACFKSHCTTSPTCPACSTSVTGFQTLMLR